MHFHSGSGYLMPTALIIAISCIVVSCAAPDPDPFNSPSTATVSHEPNVGEPVLVNLALELRRSDDMVLPEKITLSVDDVVKLGTIPVRDQIKLLEERGGIIMGMRWAVLTLEGNLDSAVKIIDMGAQTQCSSPPNGTVVRLGTWGGPQPTDAPQSPDIEFWIGTAPSGPLLFDVKTASWKPYFPDNTISLEKGAVKKVAILMRPIELLCEVGFTMTVLDGNVKTLYNITPDDQSITVLSQFEYTPSDKKTYGKEYLGGGYCGKYVEARQGWFRSPSDACGRENGNVPGTINPW